ncbi:MAG: sulfatase-like hydrolase/transferase [Propionibacteriaceae bacterium]|nr:sulfatase-like hydrolase/transferase [Propionibacteriaceae bacterium]
MPYLVDHHSDSHITRRPGRARPSKRWLVVMGVAASQAAWWPAPAQAAYIDPATTSYIIQIVSGLAITLSVAIGVFFRKIHLFAVTAVARARATWIRTRDGVRHPAVPSATSTSADTAAHHAPMTARVGASDRVLVRGQRPDATASATAHIDGTSPAAATTQSPSPSRWRTLVHDERSWQRRLGLAGLAGGAYATVYILFGALDLVGTNASELPFRATDVIGLVLGIFFVVWGGATLLLFLLRGKVFDVMASLAVSVAVAGWLQANFLNPNIGQLMGDQILWESMTAQGLVNLLVWIGVVAVIPLVRLLGQKVWTPTVVVLSAVLLTGSIVSLATTYSDPALSSSQAGAEAGYLSYKDILSVSSTRNEIVFLVDELDSKHIDTIRDQDPHFFDPLTGFTQYTQNITRYNKTFPSVVSTLTESSYSYDEPKSQYFSQAWRDATSVRSLKDAGWSVNIYSDQTEIFWSDSDIAGLLDNYETAPRQVNTSIALNGLGRLTAFTYAPTAIKPIFWMDSTIFNGSFTPKYDQDPPYEFDDPRLGRLVDTERLTVSGDQPRFSFIHFQGSHGPWTMDAQAQPTAVSDRVTQTMGVFHIIFDYIDQLKALGLYDQSTIVIMADHGTHLGQEQPRLTLPNLATLIVKEGGAPSTPMTTSEAPVTVANLWPTLLSQAGLDHPGLPYAEVPMVSTAPRMFTWFRTPTQDSPGYAQEYAVGDDARDWGSWQLLRQYSMQDDVNK